MIGGMKEGESREEYDERMDKTYEMFDAEAEKRQSRRSSSNCDCGSKPEPIDLAPVVALICWGVEKVQDWRNRKKPTPTIFDEIIEYQSTPSDTIERLQQEQNDFNERLRQI